MSKEMINRQLLKHKADTLTQDEVAEVLEYISVMQSLSEQAIKPNARDEAMLELLSIALRGASPGAKTVCIPRNATSN